MRRLIVILLFAWGLPATASESDRILVTFADPGMSNSARAGPSRPGYSRRTSSYLVSVGVRRAANRLARDYNLEVVDEWPIIPLNVLCMVYSVPDGTGVESLLQQLRERPEVESAQRLNEFEVSARPVSDTADPYTELQHNLDTLELIEAHTFSRGGGSSVTIIDTGADFNHPDLETQIRVRLDFTAHEGFDREAHGTAVAGIVGAASGNGFGITGIAPDAELTLLRACWYAEGKVTAVCDSFTLAKALTHALESKTDVVNLSLAGPHDPLLTRILGRVLDSGKVVVAAVPRSPGFPADVPGVIAVALPSAMPAGANELVAPGDEILVPVPGGGFDYASGSSLSAAHVTGVIALMIAERPDLDRDDITTLLAGSSLVGGASINACRALAKLLARGGCRATATAKVEPQEKSERD